MARLKTNRERLIDGGASGSFGLQVSQGTRTGRDGTGLATASGTSDDWPFIIAIDAGVESGRPSFWANAAGKLFTMVRLSQWIKAENNALYEKEAKELIAREAKVLTIRDNAHPLVPNGARNLQ